jgi:hypothetical protein
MFKSKVHIRSHLLLCHLSVVHGYFVCITCFKMTDVSAIGVLNFQKGRMAK